MGASENEHRGQNSAEGTTISNEPAGGEPLQTATPPTSTWGGLASRLNEVMTTGLQSLGSSQPQAAAAEPDLATAGGRSHRPSVYGLMDEAPPWTGGKGTTMPAHQRGNEVVLDRAHQPGSSNRPTDDHEVVDPSWTKRLVDWFRGANDGVRGIRAPTAVAVVGGRRLHSKVAIVTGANSGLGYETARVLCKAGARVILACRDLAKGKQAATQIEESLRAEERQEVSITHDTAWVGVDYSAVGTCEVLRLDLGDLESVRAFATEFLALECRLHYLICNAGKMATPFRRTAQGYEWQWGINFLGHFLLAQLLLPRLEMTASTTDQGARVVFVSSQEHKLGRIHWEQNCFNVDAALYEPWAAYFQSKLALVLLALELDRQLQARYARVHGGGAADQSLRPRVSAHAVHPGLCSTDITRELGAFARAGYTAGQPLYRSVGQGAACTLYCCVGEQHTLVRGGAYFEDCAEADVVSTDKEAAALRRSRPVWLLLPPR